MADTISFARGAPSLDIVDVEGLREAALREYPGAIVTVSHDRAFLDAIGTDRRLQVRDGTLVER